MFVTMNLIFDLIRGVPAVSRPFSKERFRLLSHELLGTNEHKLIRAHSCPEFVAALASLPMAAAGAYCGIGCSRMAVVLKFAAWEGKFGEN